MSLLIEDNDPEPAGPWQRSTAPPATPAYPGQPAGRQAGPASGGYQRGGYGAGYPADAYDDYPDDGYAPAYPGAASGDGYPGGRDARGVPTAGWGPPPAYGSSPQAGPGSRPYDGQDTQPLGMDLAAAMAAARDDMFAAEDYPEDGWDPDGEPGGEPEPDPDEDLRPGRRERQGRALTSGLPRLARWLWARPQWLAVLLVAAASIVAAVSLPTLLRPATGPFPGVVSSSRLTGLNFRVGGQIAAIKVRIGQAVRRGQVLALTAAAPSKAAVVQADWAAVQADKANLAVLVADAAPEASVTAAETTLAQARAQRAVDRRKLLRREILAPRAGVVAAIDAAVGQLDGPAGLPARAAANAVRQGGIAVTLGAGGRALPLIALRAAGGWQVRVRLPRASAAATRVGEPVTVAVPALRLTGIRGHVVELAQAGDPSGTEAVIEVTAAGASPLAGMTAEVRLGA